MTGEKKKKKRLNRSILLAKKIIIKDGGSVSEIFIYFPKWKSLSKILFSFVFSFFLKMTPVSVAAIVC